MILSNNFIISTPAFVLDSVISLLAIVEFEDIIRLWESYLAGSGTEPGPVFLVRSDDQAVFEVVLGFWKRRFRIVKEGSVTCGNIYAWNIRWTVSHPEL